VSHIFLVGFMGAGKSTVGRLLAERTGSPFIDLDEHIESSEGRTVQAIFAEDGEEEFREQEKKALQRVAQSGDSVVACGGGAVMGDENRATLKEAGCVVYLQVTPEEALARIGDADSRPLLAGDAGRVATSLLDARRSTYESVADVTIDTVGLRPTEIVEMICARLEPCGWSCDA
jgi:shikimate kinase